MGLVGPGEGGVSEGRFKVKAPPSASWNRTVGGSTCFNKVSSVL